LASQGHPRLGLFLAAMLGSSLIIACGCVLNNWMDRDIDTRMERTKTRALVTGTIGAWQAMVFAALLGSIGGLVLLLYTNLLTFDIGILGLVIYVVFYTLGKRYTVHATLIGSISGAVPPLAGYTAVVGHLTPVALVLFLSVALWQLPHFYAIALYRQRDYDEAKIPNLPNLIGAIRTQWLILSYIALFFGVASFLTVYGATGLLYQVLITVLCAWWLGTGLWTLSKQEGVLWGKAMFRISLLVITIFSVVIAFGRIG